MNQETDYFHLLTQLPVALFIVSSLMLIINDSGIAFLIQRRSEKKRKKNEE